MKKTVSLSALIITFFACTSMCLAQFEGVIKMKISQKSSTNPMNATQEVLIKKDNMRSNITSDNSPMGPVSMVIRRDKGVMWTLFNAMKMYMEMSLKQTEEFAKSMQKDTLVPTIKKTGKKQKILGYTCEEVLVTTSEMTATIWETTELSALAESMKQFNSSSNAQPRWMQEIEKMNLLTLKLHSEKKDGEVTDMEFTGIEKKKINDAQFEIPAGYKKQEMPAGMGQGK
jgi:hypothetical protein